MIIKLFEDMNGNPIDTTKVYRDIKNRVDDISIIEMDGNYYAQPEELDAEYLGDVCMGLAPQ